MYNTSTYTSAGTVSMDYEWYPQYQVITTYDDHTVKVYAVINGKVYEHGSHIYYTQSYPNEEKHEENIKRISKLLEKKSYILSKNHNS